MNAQLRSCLAIATVAAGVAAIPNFSNAQLSQLPPPGSVFYLQTNGNAPGVMTRGDWYTAGSENGVGAGSNFFALYVPPSWPVGRSIMIDLESPEFNDVADAGDPVDENQGGFGNAVSTRFELFGPGTNHTQSNPLLPAPNTSSPLTVATFAPSSNNRWRRFTTITNPTPGSRYLIRSDSGNYNGDNSWRVRVGTDNDGNPQNGLPANAANADGIAGTDDELVLGFMSTTFQHSGGSMQCFTYYMFVPAGTPSFRFNNFDMDNNGRVRYYAPGVAIDPDGFTGGVGGTVSSDSSWNGGTGTTRGGDLITAPTPGWWRIVYCLTDTNQAILEGPAGSVIFMDQPPIPEMTITKTANVTTVGPNAEFAYTIAVGNIAAGASAGAAHEVVITDTLPNTLIFQSATINPPLTGTVGVAGQTLTFTLNNTVKAGDSGTITVNVKVANPIPNANIVNTAVLSTYRDSLRNVYPSKNASAIVSVNVLAVDLLSLTASASGPGDTPTIEWATSSEVGTAGFDIYRDTDFVPSALTGESLFGFIGSSGGPDAGAAYRFTDPLPLTEGESRRYWLVETELDGDRHTYGPAVLTVGGASAQPSWSDYE